MAFDPDKLLDLVRSSLATAKATPGMPASVMRAAEAFARLDEHCQRADAALPDDWCNDVDDAEPEEPVVCPHCGQNVDEEPDGDDVELATDEDANG